MNQGKLKIISIDFVKTSGEKVIARADVHFYGFVLKGFKILRNPETGKEYVTPPSYHAPDKGWRPLFRTDLPEDWQEIQNRILNDYNEHLIKESLEEDDNK